MLGLVKNKNDASSNNLADHISVHFQFVRFLLVGVLNTAFGYGLFCLLIYLGMFYVIASLISTVAGVLFNFITTGNLVFGSRDKSKLSRFIAVYVITFFVNLLALNLFNSSGINLYFGAGVMILPSALLAFLLQKYYVFTRHA
jgi:putative flippase GtrA